MTSTTAVEELTKPNTDVYLTAIDNFDRAFCLISNVVDSGGKQARNRSEWLLFSDVVRAVIISGGVD